MTQENDILAKFKLVGESLISDKKNQVAREDSLPDIYEGFVKGDAKEKDDIFNSFLRGNKEKSNKKTDLNQLIEQDVQDNKTSHEQIKEKKQKASFLKQLLARIFNKDKSSESKDMGRLLAGKDLNDLKYEKLRRGRLKPSSKPSIKFSNQSVDKDFVEVLRPGQGKDLADKIANISNKEHTEDMEDIIRSKQLTNNDLQQLFLNYVSKSADSELEQSHVNNILSDPKVSKTFAGAAIGNVDRVQLEEVFIDFINLNKDLASGKELEQVESQSAKVVIEFAAAINPEFMTRDELNELFIRFCRNVSVKAPKAYNDLLSLLNNSFSHAMVLDTTMDDASRSAISGFSQAINPESMTRAELEEAFIRFVREVSTKFPAAWAEMQQMLDVAVSQAFEPDNTMDDATRGVISDFSQAINPSCMNREELESVFTRYIRLVSVKFPAAFNILAGILNQAIPNAFIEMPPDIDAHSENVILSFQQALKPEAMPREILEELFIRFVRELSVTSPAAISQLQAVLNTALPNAFVEDTSMDNASRSAIAGFSQAIKPEVMTRDTLEELFIRFSREISVKYPAAWAEMQGMLSSALGSAFVEDNSMDNASRSAIAGFSQALKPEMMTRDELNELFIRFSREVSVKYPAAWGELQAMLSVAVSNAFMPDTSMDDSSRAAIAGFAQVIKPDTMTRDDLNELFLRFSREVSVKFPAAWAELQGMLNEALPHAFMPDTTMDDASRSAIATFAMNITPDIMTREELETVFLRSVKLVSVNFPAAWAELQGMLNTALPHAFIPDNTMDDDTKSLLGDFQSIIANQEFNDDQLEAIFADYMVQVPLMFPVVKAMIENTVRAKRGDADNLDKKEKKTDQDYESIQKDFNKVSDKSENLDLKAQKLSKDLKLASSKEEITDFQQQLRRVQQDKSNLDVEHGAKKEDIGSNLKANEHIKDTYVKKLNISFDKKSDRDLFEVDTKKLTNWDMLRTLRRGEVLDTMNELPKEHLVESLYVVPKHLLKKAITQLPVEDMCRVLFNARFPEALLRSMPRKKAIELLPDPQEMLPILMTMGRVAGFKNGCDFLEEVVVKGMKVEPEQNDTRTEEELLPFVQEQLVAKTPRNADAKNPVQGVQSPIEKMLKSVEEDQAMFNDMASGKEAKEEKLKNKYKRPESLNPVQLERLAKETMKSFSKEDKKQALGAKRGTPSQILEFLESMKKVSDLASAKMAVSVLSVAQTKAVAKAALPLLETRHLVKISRNYGKSSKEMVKQMPRYTIEGLVKSLPKHFMIQGFKLLDKSMVCGMLKTQSSQTIARVASEMLSRDMVKDRAFKKKGFV